VIFAIFSENDLFFDYCAVFLGLLFLAGAILLRRPDRLVFGAILLPRPALPRLTAKK